MGASIASHGSADKPLPQQPKIQVSSDETRLAQAIAKARKVVETFVLRNTSAEDTPSLAATKAALAVMATNCGAPEIARYWNSLLWSYDTEYSCRLEKFHRISSPAVLKAKLEKHRLAPDEVGFLVGVHAIVQPYLDAMTWAVFEYRLAESAGSQLRDRKAIECLGGIPEVADILVDFSEGRFGFAELNQKLLQRTGRCLDTPTVRY